VRIPVGRDSTKADLQGTAPLGGLLRRAPVPAPRRRRPVLPAAIVALALLFRCAVVLADTGYLPAHDAYDYDRHAISIAAGDGYPESGYAQDGGPTALRPPAYPYVLGGVYALAADSLTAGRLLNAVLGALAVLLLYLIVAVIWGRRVALLAGALAAVFPPLVLLSRDLLSESLFIVFELAAVLCVLRFRRSGGALRWAVAAGALCGLAALTREVGLLLLVPIALGTWLSHRRRSVRSLLAPALVAISACLAISPWALRNASEFGRFIPVASSTGFSLAGTYNRVSLEGRVHHAAWRTPVLVPEYSALFDRHGIDEATIDANLRTDATRFAWQHPGYVAEATGANLLRLFYLSGDSVVGLGDRPVTQRGIGSGSSLIERLSLAAAVAFALLGVVEIARSQRRARGERWAPTVPRGPWFLWAVPILLVAAAAPVNGLPRYRLPADPFLLILAAVGVAFAWDRVETLRARGGRAIRTAAGVLAVTTIVALPGCGGGSSTAGETGTGSTKQVAPPSAPASQGDPSSRRFVRQGNAICSQLTVEAAGLGQRLRQGVEPNELFGPAIRILERQANRFRALPLSPGDTTTRRYVELFDPLEELVHQRAHAGAIGAIGEEQELDQLISPLAREQREFARASGLTACDVDFGRVFIEAGR
jgi:4-amino-4-deoxy-L-arabinose transferase-like glycosyltransferase